MQAPIESNDFQEKYKIILLRKIILPSNGLGA